MLLRETGISSDALRQYAEPMGDGELAAVAGGEDVSYKCRKCGMNFGNPIGLWAHEEIWCSKNF